MPPNVRLSCKWRTQCAVLGTGHVSHALICRNYRSFRPVSALCGWEDFFRHFGVVALSGERSRCWRWPSRLSLESRHLYERTPHSYRYRLSSVEKAEACVRAACVWFPGLEFRTWFGSWVDRQYRSDTDLRCSRSLASRCRTGRMIRHPLVFAPQALPGRAWRSV